MPTLTEHQDRYDKAERNFLEREFRILKTQCDKKKIPLSVSLQESGLDGFIEYATKSNHILGQRIDLKRIDLIKDSIGFDDIVFRTLPWKQKIKGTRKWRTLEHPDRIPGFGVELNLLGWSWFFGQSTSMQEINDELTKGRTIEQIFNKKPRERGRGTTQFLTLDGDRLSTKEALERSSVFPQAYYRELESMRKAMGKEDLPEEVRQSVFDDIRKKVNRKNRGFRRLGGKWWVALTDEGKDALETLSKENGVLPSEWLDDFLQYQ